MWGVCQLKQGVPSSKIQQLNLRRCKGVWSKVNASQSEKQCLRMSFMWNRFLTTALPMSLWLKLFTWSSELIDSKLGWRVPVSLTQRDPSMHDIPGMKEGILTTETAWRYNCKLVVTHNTMMRKCNPQCDADLNDSDENSRLLADMHCQPASGRLVYGLPQARISQRLPSCLSSWGREKIAPIVSKECYSDLTYTTVDAHPWHGNKVTLASMNFPLKSSSSVSPARVWQLSPLGILGRWV